MKRCLLLFAGLLIGYLAFSQPAYTTKQYPVLVEQDLSYGTVVNYAGQNETLRLDLYKPQGDANCQRPLVVIIHGGAWIAGTKTDPEVVALCNEMAARGYVAASIQYRLGSHKASFYVPYALCNNQINPLGINQCIYAADSSEVMRALYRAMQDAKGAIRFLKGRHTVDSTDVDNVFVSGVSAGGFTALYTAFLTSPGEKPVDAGALSNAPTPDPDLTNCLPAGYSLARPDLGSIEGSLNVNGYTAKVKGVGNFYGGVFNLQLFTGPDTPLVYLYHQRKDVVVSCDRAKVLGPLYSLCIAPLNLCQPLAGMPIAWGSCAIEDYLNPASATLPWLKNDINYTGQPDCLANPPGHSIDNIALRAGNLADFWAPAIAASGNIPPNGCATATDPLAELPFSHFLDEKENTLWLTSSAGTAFSWSLADLNGKVLKSGSHTPTLQQERVSIEGFTPGVYILAFRSGNNFQVSKLLLR